MQSELHSDQSQAYQAQMRYHKLDDGDCKPNMADHGLQKQQANKNSLSQPASSASLLGALRRLSKDGRLLLVCRALRLFGFGFLAVILVLYLKAMGYSIAKIGLLLTLTLLGDAAMSIYMTSRADSLGRRRMLRVGAILKVITAAVFATTSNFWVLLITAIFGVISPSGWSMAKWISEAVHWNKKGFQLNAIPLYPRKEVGPFLAVEQAALAQTVPASDRTRVFAWYNLFGELSSALGALICGLIVSYLTEGPYKLSELDSYRIVMVVYTFIAIVVFLLFLALSPDVETSNGADKPLPVKQFLGLHESKGLILRLSLLFFIDAFAGGLVLQSMISDWFVTKFGSRAATLGSIVFSCNLVAALSSLFAVPLADYIGLIWTMFITHLPSNVLLILVPLMPNEILAIIMLVLRFSISQCDVPTRNSFVMAVVKEDERSAAAGVTGCCRSIAVSTSPYVSGILYASSSLSSYPFYLAGSLKIFYDILLLSAFAAVRIPEEKDRSELHLLKPEEEES